MNFRELDDVIGEKSLLMPIHKSVQKDGYQSIYKEYSKNITDNLLYIIDLIYQKKYILIKSISNL